MYYRHGLSDELNGWLLETFIFPKRMWSGVRKRNGTFVLTMVFREFEASQAAIEMKVIDLPKQPCFLEHLLVVFKLAFQSPLVGS